MDQGEVGHEIGRREWQNRERYLPERARGHLSDAEYRRASAKKRSDTAKGKQFSAQPNDVANKTAHDRETGHDTTRAELMKLAANKKIAGRSRMKKAQLEKAVHGHG
jgi:hypothetical protein